MNWLGEIEESMLNDVKAEKVGGGTLESGIYLSTIKQAFLRQTDSGAVMFELQCVSADEQSIFWSTCAKSGDEKGNKATYTDKNGKEQLLPGVVSIKHMFEACKVPMTTEPTAHQVEFKDGIIDAKVFKELTGKKFTACVRQYENEYNGEINIRYDIEHFLDADGKNKDGEDMTEKFSAKIAKFPIKTLRKPKATTAKATADTIASGW